MDINIENLLAMAEKGEKINICCGITEVEHILASVQESLPNAGICLSVDHLNQRMSVKEYLVFFAGLWGTRKKVKNAIKTMQLEDLKNTNLNKLDAGQKKRVAVAREIIHNTDVYYLQEPLLDLKDKDKNIITEWADALENKGYITTTAAQQYAIDMPGEAYIFENGKYSPVKKVKEYPSLLIDKVTAQKDGSVFLFNPSEIDYAESANGKIEVVVNKENYVCTMTLDELEQKLTRYGFYRCHRSYIVNMQKVREIVKWTKNSYSLKLNSYDDISIPLSKGRIEEMRKIYMF